MAKLAEKEGYQVIHPFDDRRIIAGQGTLGLELMQDLDGVDVVLCAVSGGGLISGVATAVKALAPRVEVIGVQPQGSQAAKQSLQQGRPVSVDKAASIADGLLALRPGDMTFGIMRRLLDDILLVSEEAILQAMGLIARHLKVIAEPSGAVGLAAILEHQERFRGRRVAVILSGGNANPEVVSRAMNAIPRYGAGV